MTEKHQNRRKEIIAAYREHGTLRRAAKALGISRSRVHQIVQDYAGHLMQPHGVRADRRRDQL